VIVLRLSGCRLSITQRAGDLEGLISRSLATEQGGSQSNSVRRALAILEFLKDSERHRNLSEISRKLSLPKSTTSVLLSTLAGMGYITRDATERRYSLTTKSFGLGLELLNQLDLSRRSRPTLESIAAAFSVTAHVAVLDGDQALFVNKADCVQQPCCDIYPGRRTDLQCTAVGKILLAYLSEEAQRAFLARHRSIRHTTRTIASPKELMEEFVSIRKRGYAFDDQEQELNVRCLAVSVFSEQQPVAALGITGTVFEIRPDNIEHLAAYLKKVSGQIFAQ
jgi:DNA-binding IclR family transcriptional regulator